MSAPVWSVPGGRCPVGLPVMASIIVTGPSDGTSLRQAMLGPRAILAGVALPA
jgi:hypothetical protein